MSIYNVNVFWIVQCNHGIRNLNLSWHLNLCLTMLISRKTDNVYKYVNTIENLSSTLRCIENNLKWDILLGNCPQWYGRVMSFVKLSCRFHVLCRIYIPAKSFTVISSLRIFSCGVYRHHISRTPPTQSM